MAEVFERVYLGVGSNLGDRLAHLKRAELLLKKVPRTRFLRSSSVIETDPVGGGPQDPKYLNAVWEIETALPPETLKESLSQIEIELGRRKPFRNAPREIDLDILFYGDRVLKTERLEIPHRRLHERAFVLRPLAELVPDWKHPTLKKTVRELLNNL